VFIVFLLDNKFKSNKIFFVSSSSLSGDSDLNQGYDYEEASNVKAIDQCSIIKDNKTSISSLIEPISDKIIA